MIDTDTYLYILYHILLCILNHTAEKRIILSVNISYCFLLFDYMVFRSLLTLHRFHHKMTSAGKPLRTRRIPTVLLLQYQVHHQYILT